MEVTILNNGKVVISVQETRKEILPGVFLTCLQTDKFKTGLIRVPFPISRDRSPNFALKLNVGAK